MMDNKLLKKMGWAIWIAYGALLLINVIDYWLSYGRISPLGVLMLVIYVIASIVMPLLGIPIFTTKGWKARALMMLLLLAGLIGYLMFIVMR